MESLLLPALYRFHGKWAATQEHAESRKKCFSMAGVLSSGGYYFEYTRFGDELMKRMLVLFVAFAMSQNVANAMELLLNGDLNLTFQNPPGSEALYYPEFVDWTITTDPCSYSPCPILPYVPGGVYTPYAGYPAGFADRLGGGNGLIGAAFEGHYPFEITGPVDVEISQAVAGVVGKTYTMSGWAHFEGGYAGGVEFLDIASPNQRNQDAQLINPGVPVAALTNTIFALDFLDNMGAVLPGSLEIELHDDAGQQNDNEFDGRTWIQHTLSAVAPAGTVSVRVRAGMIDGEFNVDMPHQNVFFDDFSLTCVPEPGSLILGLMGLAFLGAGRRSR